MTAREFERFSSMARAQQVRRQVAEFLAGCVVAVVILIVMAALG